MPTPEDRIASRPRGPLGPLLGSWLRYLRAVRNLAPRSLDIYIDSGCQFDEWLATLDEPPPIDEIRRDHIVDWMDHLASLGRSAATRSSRYRSIQQFFKWAEDEGEITTSPMLKLKPPMVPEQPVPVVREDELRELLATLAARDFLTVRDNAIVRLFLDTGIRLSELAGLQVDDVNLDYREVRIVAKGRRARHVRYGAKTSVAMDRYFRARRKERTAALPAWWLSQHGRGGMTADGVYQMIVRRALAVGLDVHPHQLRHSWAHHFLAAGGNETDLMHNAGWRSRQMLSRYARSTAEERAREAAERLALGDRL